MPIVKSIKNIIFGISNYIYSFLSQSHFTIPVNNTIIIDIKYNINVYYVISCCNSLSS